MDSRAVQTDEDSVGQGGPLGTDGAAIGTSLEGIIAQWEENQIRGFRGSRGAA